MTTPGPITEVREVKWEEFPRRLFSSFPLVSIMYSGLTWVVTLNIMIYLSTINYSFMVNPRRLYLKSK